MSASNVTGADSAETTAGPAEFDIGHCDDFPPDTGTCVRVGNHLLALFRTPSGIHVFDASCPHAGGPLHQGLVRGDTVTCPWHWWRFRLETGERVGAPTIRLRRYPATVRNGRVVVQVPAEPVATSLRERLLAAGRRWREETLQEPADLPSRPAAP